jgi:Family of unknown function (DUF6988)
MRKKSRDRQKAIQEAYRAKHEDRVASSLQKSKKIWARLVGLLQGEYSDETRTLLLIGYSDVVFEHQRAIRQLLETGLYGSAFALVRVLHDPFFRAHWMLKCANDKQVEAIRATDDRSNFPAMAQMVKDIDGAYDTGTFFSKFINDSWEAMNSYTHTGLRQLSRRFTGGHVRPNYSDDEILEVINTTTVAICFTARLVLMAVGRQKEADEAEQIGIDFAKS